MNYNKEDYIGARIQLYPSDTYKKFGIIDDVNDLGFTIVITKSEEPENSRKYVVGKRYFISHSIGIRFKFMED